MATNSGLPGYPTQQTIAQQAAQAAQAAVPTTQSINQQYQRSLGDVSGFTRAVISLLQGGPGVGAGYTQAADQQRAVDAAAQARLAALGVPYAGSQAVAGAQGDSALANLLSRQAAAQSYGAQLPHVAAARGALMQQGLISQRNQALTQRGQDYRQAYLSGLDQARQNALAMAVATGNYQNQQQSLALQQASLGLQQASLAERQREFGITHSPSYLRFVAGLQAQTTPTAQNPAPWTQYGLTGNEWRGLAVQAGQGAQSATQHRVPFAQFLNEAINVNQIPPNLALVTASKIYGAFKDAPAGSSGALAYQSYRRWVSAFNVKKWQATYGKQFKNKPGQFITTPPGYAH